MQDAWLDGDPCPAAASQGRLTREFGRQREIPQVPSGRGSGGLRGRDEDFLSLESSAKLIISPLPLASERYLGGK